MPGNSNLHDSSRNKQDEYLHISLPLWQLLLCYKAAMTTT